MSLIVLVDTDILIDVAREIQIAINRLQLEAKNAVLAISVITKMELIVGCRNKTELQSLQQFLGHYTLMPVTEDVSNKAVELLTTYRLSHGLLIPDALIASTAIVNKISWLTRNKSDYHFISGINLLAYP
ncbi:MAG: type II toxin-antitoxin system VapC family toxin [Microcystaceae cyanobacterium]